MASSSSSPPSAPTFSSHPWKYHVFLSFRGEDTRKTFVDHLYTALEQRGIYTYKDDVTLPRGESIGPSLKKAIKESQIAVIIFSENYADSSWCLDELACIMKCRDMKGQIVMPIFYGADPSDVRKQKNKYGEAFAKYELENKKKIKSWGQAFLDDPWGWLFAWQQQYRNYSEARAIHESELKAKVISWRKALVDASNISGWEPKEIANGHESKAIEEIVDIISRRLQLVISSVNVNLIGIAARVQVLKSKLKIGSGGVRMIGIWGVGGGGKTTLASSIYDEIYRQFDGCCFIKDIREESRKNGLEKLQEKIILGVLKQKQVRAIERVEEGRHMIKERLCHRKVLIVLDDVDHLEHLKELAGSHDWFGDGSRIIITTRDEHVLNALRVDVTHEISLLNDDEAIMLFCKHAPGDNIPVKDYKKLSKEVVSYAGGLPLALTVLGSFLCDKDIDEWKSTLEKLKDIPDTDIVEKLKISFNGLKPYEKELFLDIACFFRREDKDEAMIILDACGFHPVIGVRVLIQKALITISEDGEFDMHDLVQQMGHHIVRGEHRNNPEKHSRVWKREDVLRICAMDAMTVLDMIEVIKYRGDYLSQHLPPMVANIKNLRWIDWEGDFSSHLPTNFPQGTLCCLILRYSLQEQLWEGYKLLPNLKTIELFGLANLIKTPDFNGLPNLERFVLRGCWCLEEIHPSIGSLERLVFLFIKDCPRLKMFPPIPGLKKLKTLTFSWCAQHLDFSEIQSSANVFVVCGRCGCCNLLGVECCLRDNNMNRIALEFFLRDLRELNLEHCSLGDEEMGSAVWELPSLTTLHLEGNGFSRLSFSRLRLPQLKLLNVTNCQGLVELSELPSSIAVVVANRCPSLKSFGDISNCKWLWNVSLLLGDDLGGDILLDSSLQLKNEPVCDKLLDSMLQGNASEDHFINIILEHQIPNKIRGRLFRWSTSRMDYQLDRMDQLDKNKVTFTLRLPIDWYNDFCGFLICVTNISYPKVNIVMRQEVDEEESRFEQWQESSEAVGPKCYLEPTCVGYVSFGSLRHTAFIKPSYTLISVSLDCTMYSDMFMHDVQVELVPRKGITDEVQTTKVATDSSEFWGEVPNFRNPFRIKNDSSSSINIFWQPLLETEVSTTQSATE